ARGIGLTFVALGGFFLAVACFVAASACTAPTAAMIKPTTKLRYVPCFILPPDCANNRPAAPLKDKTPEKADQSLRHLIHLRDSMCRNEPLCLSKLVHALGTAVLFRAPAQAGDWKAALIRRNTNRCRHHACRADRFVSRIFVAGQAVTST